MSGLSADSVPRLHTVVCWAADARDKRPSRLLPRLLTIIILVGTLAGCEGLLRPTELQRPELPGVGPPPAGIVEPALLGDGISNAGESAPILAQPYIQKGSGVFVGQVTPVAKGTDQATSEAGGEPVSLNFVNSDAKAVVEAVLGDLLKLNYTVSPGLQGTVTLSTSAPIRQSEVLPLISEVLSMQGIVIVQVGSLYEVLPAQEAATRGLAVTAPNSRPTGASTQIIPFRHVSAQKVAEILQPMLGPSAGLRTDATRNILIAWGAPQDLVNISEFARIFDVNQLGGMSFALLPLRNAEAEDVAKELEQIFVDNDPSLRDVLKIVPIQRINSMLVVSKIPGFLDAAQDWIDRLDQVTSAGLFVRVYNVQNRRATDVAKILVDLFAGGESASIGSNSGPVAPGLTPRTVASPAEVTVDSEIGIDGPVAYSAGTEPPASFLAAETPSAVYGSAASVTVGPKVRIIPDDAYNALVVLADTAGHATIEATLHQLDVQPMQVLIEATIAEVTLNDELRYGVRWFFESGNNSAILTGDALGAVGAIFPGFSYLFSSSSAEVAISALQSVTDVEVISSPSLLVLDNQSAKLQVGDQVPIATRSAVDVGNDDSPIVNQLEYRDTGVILQITPRVNAGGLVLIEIVQEVSDVVETTTSGIDSPTIQQRKFESTVSVQSAQTVALGGLIRNRQEFGKSGVPVLSDIPLLGNLFSETDERGRRTELLVLLKPTVVRGPDQLHAVTEELRGRIWDDDSFAVP